jgi:hypothetical protein
MAAAIAALLADAEARDLIGRRASRYVRETHAPDRVCAAFERLAKPDLACARR